MIPRNGIRGTEGSYNISSANGTTVCPVCGHEGDSRNRAISRMGEGLEGRTNAVKFKTLNKALMVFLNEPQASQLKPEEVDFHKEQNREAHKTDEYDLENLIIRRGQEFDVTVTFNRAYNSKTDVIVLQFVTGNQPQESKGTIVRVVLHDALTPTQWGMKIKEISGKTLSLTVMSSAKAIIGEYEVFVETQMKDATGEKSVFRYKDTDKVCILFNAWCKDDAVYMDKEEDRNEYVLADRGYIWVGSANWNEGIPWNFGQFEDVALPCALWLLDNGPLSVIAKSSPIQVARFMSAMVNFNDDDGGILVGRWAYPYPEDSTPPTDWTGSVAILDEFWKSKKMVKYGQCWVFSGLSTTLLRALGLPTRSVTNFASAHDTDSSMTIDFHFDKEDNPLEYLNDSIWNFHVWNESWFKRPDLPAGHDGWQAHDATPQETSEGVFCCGPASVNAVKNGEVYLPYDTRFVFSEVNGDKVSWVVDGDGSMTAFKQETGSIGKCISTLMPGADGPCRNDVTSDYKHPEGSKEEREAVGFAHKFSSRETELSIFHAEKEDVHFNSDVVDDVVIGDSFDVKVVVKNNSRDKRTVRVNITSIMAFYTGIPAKPMQRKKDTLHLGAKEEKSVVLTIAAADYMDKMAGDGSIKLYFKGTVEETSQADAAQEVVEIRKPKLMVTANPEVVKKGEKVEVTALFKNSTPMTLTNGKFHFEAIGMSPKSMKMTCLGPVTSKMEAKAMATFTATRRAHKPAVVTVSFRSDELTGVRGECTVNKD